MEYYNGNVDQLPGEPELAFSLRPTEGIDPKKRKAQKYKIVKQMNYNKELRYMTKILKVKSIETLVDVGLIVHHIGTA